MSTIERHEVPATQKREYRNNTSGWLGVITLDHLGQEHGISVEPGETIWLSDAEAILTSRAPRRAEDNPFNERTYVVVDPATGARSEVKMRPLTLVSDRKRDVYASDRYVPGITDDAEAHAQTRAAAAAGTDAPRTAMTAAAEQRVVASPQMRQDVELPPGLATPVPPSTGAPAPEAPTPPTATPNPPSTGSLAGRQAQAPEVAASWTEPPEAPGRVLPGALGGDEGLTRDTSDPTQPKRGDRVRARPQAAPQTVGAAKGAEEHAQAVDPTIDEETGAAKPPVQPPVEGEYGQAEEVGSPEAPRRRARRAGAEGE